MARSPSLPLSEYGELSSPDPLASSQHNEDYRYATRSPSPVKRQFSSPTKRQRTGPSADATPPRTNHSQWMNATSPSKTVTEQTLSPWKIRVTVETEPEDMNTHAGRASSRTIMVPLRDASSPSQEGTRTTRGRGKQPGTTKSRRSATPVRKNSRSRSRRQSVTDLDITVLGDEGDSNIWTKQRSPRKRRSTPIRKPPLKVDREDVAERQQTTGGKTTRQANKSAQPVEIREDTDAEEDVVVGNGLESDSPELRSIDLNRVAVRSRSMSIKQRPTNLPGQDTRLTEVETDEDTNVFENDPNHVSVVSTSYPTPDPSVQEDQEAKEHTPTLHDDHEGFDTILESEGFTMIDLESIPSARHFFSSPLEAQGTLQAPEPARPPQSNDLDPPILHPTPSAIQPPKPMPKAIPSYLISPEGDTDISSNVPSSPPVLSQPPTAPPSISAIPHQETTPQVYSSPKLPSPPKVIQSNRKQDDAQIRKSPPPSLAKVVKAGIALQGVLSPKPKDKTCTPGGSSVERIDNLFEGFDSGTRRELRAGLRFGEELAKRQRSSPDLKKPEVGKIRPGRAPFQGHCGTRSAQHPVTSTQIWRGETVVQQTPVQPAVNEGMVEDLSEMEPTSRQKRSSEQSLPKKRSSLSQETRFSSSTPQTNTTDFESQLVAGSRKRRETQWQREREAVSKEIENASSSQIVVISSDNQDETNTNNNSDQPEGLNKGIQDDLDIWCEEAASCDQRSLKAVVRPVRASQVDTSPDLDHKRQRDFPHGVKKPRRSVIPSPWRGGDDVAADSSHLTNGDMTGLFYHEPKSKIKFGAAEIERQKRQFSSGSFDIDRMAGTLPKDHVINSQVSAAETDSPETLDSDAWQLQTELGSNHDHVDTTAGHFQPSSPETLTQDSFTAESQIEHLETVSEYTGGDTSISLPPQPVKVPVKVPVNFNDSTLSDIAPCLPRSSPSTAPESSRPSTPRSALKGARQSLGLDVVNSPAVRKVVFSIHEIRVDMNGREEQLSMHSVSSSPEVVQYNDTEKEPSLAPERKEDSPQQTLGLLGWLWNGGKNTNNVPPSTDGANDQESRPHRKQTSTSQNPSTSRGTTKRLQTPSYLLPPSYPSDPTRDTQIPMSTSGDFTNTHFRTLHIIYAKSLRPRFHAPKAHEVRLSVKKLLGAAFEADESQSGLGVFEWKVDEIALKVLERFMREIEWGYPASSEVKWEWTEKEICERLFRVIVGEEVRKEEKAALERVEA